MAELRIRVGSLNQVKVGAVRQILQDYARLAHASVDGVRAESGVPAQPTSLEETVRGATNRARNAFRDCEYAVGLESGLMRVPGSKTGYMDVCVCAIYDGKEFHFGLSSAWESPDKKILQMITEGGMEMDQAINWAGLTRNPAVGSEEGAIGILTRGRLNRREHAMQALRTALIHLDNPSL